MKFTLTLLLLPLLLLTGCQTRSLAGGPLRNHYFEDPAVWRLVRAAEMGRTAEVARLINEEGVDVNARGKLDFTPLHHHALFATSRRGLIALLENGADPELTNEHGLSAFHAAATRSQTFFLEEMLKRGANPNIITLSRGETPLMVANSRNHPDSMWLLLDYGADIDQQDYNWNTVLLRNVTGSFQLRLSYLLIQKGADPSI